MIHIVYVLAQLEKMEHNLSEEQIKEFYDLGQEAMKAYLKDTPVPDYTLDALAERILALSEDSNVEDKIFEIVDDYIINAGQWQELAKSKWFDNEVLPLIEESTGYVTSDVGEERSVLQLHPPVNLKDIEKRQMEANIDELSEIVLEGLQIAEEYYIEDLLFAKLDSMLPKEELGIPIEMPLQTERIDHAAL
jgi:hypothetical protein